MAVLSYAWLNLWDEHFLILSYIVDFPSTRHRGPRRIILVAHPEFYVGPFHGEQTMTAALSLFAAPYKEDVSAR